MKVNLVELYFDFAAAVRTVQSRENKPAQNAHIVVAVHARQHADRVVFVDVLATETALSGGSRQPERTRAPDQPNYGVEARRRADEKGPCSGEYVAYMLLWFLFAAVLWQADLAIQLLLVHFSG